MNGNGKFFKWAAGGLAILILVLVQVGIGDVQDDTATARRLSQDNARRIDSTNVRIERHLDRHELDQAKMMLQLAAIAEKLNVPVVVDTTRKDST